MFDKYPLFHVGYPWAGNTALQTRIFPELPDIDYLGRYEIIQQHNIISNLAELSKHVAYQEDSNIVKFYQAISTADSMNYNLANTRKLLKAAVKNCTQPRVIFSWEGITKLGSGSPDLTAKAQRLRELFISVKIIIIIREQKQISEACFKEYLARQEAQPDMPTLSIDAWFEEQMNPGQYNFTDTLYFDQIAKLYSSIFGHSNVMVLPYEMMLEDPLEFSNSLAGFAGLDGNELHGLIKKAIDDGAFWDPEEKWADNRSGSIINKLAKLFSGDDDQLFSQKATQYFGNKYAKSNANICRDWDLELAKFGYAL
jgi:hypothetical protein